MSILRLAGGPIPPENYTGSADELFQYSVIDGDGDLSQSTLTIDVSAVTGGSNFAKNEYIFTNQGGTAVIPEGVLLANDTAGTTITGIANTNGATSVVQGGGNITFTDTGTAGDPLYITPHWVLPAIPHM